MGGNATKWQQRRRQQEKAPRVETPEVEKDDESVRTNQEMLDDMYESAGIEIDYAWVRVSDVIAMGPQTMAVYGSYFFSDRNLEIWSLIGFQQSMSDDFKWLDNF